MYNVPEDCVDHPEAPWNLSKEYFCPDCGGEMTLADKSYHQLVDMKELECDNCGHSLFIGGNYEI